MNKLIPVLSALADPIRLEAMRIVSGGGEHCVCELMQTLKISQSCMSRHMATLKAAGLVTARRDAQWVCYTRNPATPPAIEAVVNSVLHATAAPSTQRTSNKERRTPPWKSKFSGRAARTA